MFKISWRYVRTYITIAVYLISPLNTLINGQIGEGGFVFGFSCQFSQNSRYTLAYLSYDINSKCAGKPWPWRVEWWFKLCFWPLCDRSGGFWSRGKPQNRRFNLKSIGQDGGIPDRNFWRSMILRTIYRLIRNFDLELFKSIAWYS